MCLGAALGEEEEGQEDVRLTCAGLRRWVLMMGVHLAGDLVRGKAHCRAQREEMPGVGPTSSAVAKMSLCFQERHCHLSVSDDAVGDHRPVSALTPGFQPVNKHLPW